MGKSPLGPFEYKGIIIDNDGCDPASWNNHGSIECVNGQWYVFYHRCSRGTEMHRRLCIEKIQINDDGTIDEVKMTSQGVGAPFASGEQIMGYQACGLTGSAYIAPDEKGEERLSHISAGDTIVFRYVAAKTGFTEAELTVCGSGSLQILLDGELVGSVDAAEGGECRKLCVPLTPVAGEMELKLVVTASEDLEIYGVTLFE